MNAQIDMSLQPASTKAPSEHAVRQAIDALFTGSGAAPDLKLFAHRARSLLAADVVAIGTPDPQRNRIVFRASTGTAGQSGLWESTRGTTLSATVLLAGDVVVESRYDLFAVGAFPGLGSRAVAAAPALSGACVHAVVYAWWPPSYGWSAERVDLLRRLAHALALAISSTRMAFEQAAELLERELGRVIAELHDRVVQPLSTVRLLGDSLPGAWAADALDGERRLRRLSELARIALAETRNIIESHGAQGRASAISRQSRSLLSIERIRALGLPSAIGESLYALFSTQVEVVVTRASYVTQAPHVEETLLIVCQEAASNAVRHGRASMIVVDLSSDSTSVWLRVRDNGTGMGQPGGSPPCPGGVGLQSMRERMSRIGGELNIAAVAPTGLELRARAPRVDLEGTGRIA